VYHHDIDRQPARSVVRAIAAAHRRTVDPQNAAAAGTRDVEACLMARYCIH